MFGAQNIVLTGALHSGKSTLVRTVLKRTEPLRRGIFSVPLIDGDRCIGYALQFNNEERLHVFAHQNMISALRFDRYGINLEPFSAAADYIRRALDQPSALFVIDEIGVMEERAEAYWQAIAELAASPMPTLLVVQQRALPMLKRVIDLEHLQIFELLTDHRQQTVTAILQALAAVDKKADRWSSNFNEENEK